jgi:thioredoxin-like negative regulator of GroEL
MPRLAVPAEVFCSSGGPNPSTTNAAFRSTPLLVLFHAAWSGESRTLQSALEQAAVQLEPCVRLASVDGAALPDLVP